MLDSQNTKKSHLDLLQENSWQLELLVSGFVIFGLLNAIEPIQEMGMKASYEENRFVIGISGLLLSSVYILIFNLLLHLVFRSLWIGALGLRSVSGEVEFDELNYSKKFTRFLKKKVGSFDQYINRLEKISSVIFAISFLLIFYLLSIFIVFQLIALVVPKLIPIENNFFNFLFRAIIIFYLIGALLTFIDFITLGLLKKKKWVAKIYFPIYRFFSFITLSFLYRPLTYNLLDNKFGRRISLLLIPGFIAVLLISSISYQSSNYLRIGYLEKPTTKIADGSSYADYVEEQEIYPNVFTIQSKVVTEPYLHIKLPFKPNMEDAIFEFNEELRPEKDLRGYKTSVVVAINDSYKSDLYDSEEFKNIFNKYVDTFNRVYSVEIDSTKFESEFVVYKEESNGFEMFVPTEQLAEGKHMITLRKRLHPKTDSVRVLERVPFWYYKQ